MYIGVEFLVEGPFSNVFTVFARVAFTSLKPSFVSSSTKGFDIPSKFSDGGQTLHICYTFYDSF